MDAALRALNRYGLGARAGERARISDARAWLRGQLEGGPPTLHSPGIPGPAAIGDAMRAFRMTQGAGPDRQRARRHLVEVATTEMDAALTARVTSDRPFVERLVAFWSNHLCVSAGAKLLVAPLAGSYERDVIRTHVLGRFEDMVLASAKHPAMLLYLDNFQSIGPASRGARIGRRERGLNENYARELLELHTLGVDGGYTQQDVQELARMLTGWTVEGLFGGRGAAGRRGAGRGRARIAQIGTAPSGPVRFVFQDVLHEPGAKTLLGIRYREAGVSEAERAIRALCAHPSTARFVATRLVTHFVADEPPPRAVDRIARVFRESRGDLRIVAGALIELPEVWDPQGRKFRSPQDWLVAVLRAFHATDVQDAAAIILRQLRHPLWSPQAPKGFGDRVSDWADPDSLLNRAELARTLARRTARRKIDPRILLDVVDVPPDDPLRRFLGDSSIAADERMALALAGPAFQWR